MKASLPKCIAFFSLALIVVFTLYAPGSAQASKGARILLINSYHDGYKWTDDIVSGVKSTLQKDNDLRIEYMDTRHIYTKKYRETLYDLFRIKFRNQSYDIIIVSDDPALDLILDLREELFPDTPVVFCGINDFTDARLRGKQLYTGVVEDIDVRKTLDLAHRLHPEARKVIAPVNSNATGIANRHLLEKMMPLFKGVFDIEIVQDPELMPFLDRLKKLPRNEYIVLLMGRFQTEKGNVIPINISTQQIAEAGIPIYSLWEFYLGEGIIGGRLAVGFYQGKTAGEVSQRILNGEKNIPIMRESPNKYMFDFRTLNRFGIGLNMLPKGSIIVNKPLSFYDKHHNAIWVAVSLILFFSIITALLLSLIMKKNKAEKELRLYQSNLELIVAERTAELNAEIHGHRLAEQELKESEQDQRKLAYELEAIIDSFPGLIFYKDRENRFIRVNRSLAEAQNMSKDQFEGKSCFDLYPSDEAQAYWDDDREVIESGKAKLNIEESMITQEGTKWVLTSKIPFSDRSGNIVGVIGISQDITKRKKEEEEREKLVLELKEALSKIKTLSGLLPICASCKKIRNDEGYWEQIEGYIRNRSEAEFSHGICPDCSKRLYPELFKKEKL